jgi:D-alanyl-D-alanine carboxypeptidase
MRLPLLPALVVALATPASAQNIDTVALRARLQARVDSFRLSGKMPGVSAAVALPNGKIISVVSGLADTARHQPLTIDARMPQGSTGKTYYAAIAWQLIGTGQLDPDALVSKYLGDRPWFRRMPNADSIRVRHLLTHTSGVMRYEFKETFLEQVRKDPYRKWPREELLSYVFDEKPRFAAGQGWEYSDTNYFLVGMIIEKLLGRPLQDEVKRRFLDPLRLTNTIANTSPRLPGVVQGYAGANNGFANGDAMIGPDGRMLLDPDFEWAGGGYSSTAADLARWAQLVYGGTIVDSSLVRRAVDAAVPARGLGANAKYGYGVIVRDTTWGHSGFFPGYQTEMRYFPSSRIAVAVMVNSSAPGTFARGQNPGTLANDLAMMSIMR